MDEIRRTELDPHAIAEHLHQAAETRRGAALSGPAGWRGVGALEGLEDGEILAIRPEVSGATAPPEGTHVRVDVRTHRLQLSFYASTRGTDEAGRWVVDMPSILEVRAGTAAPQVGTERHSVRLELDGLGLRPVLDLAVFGLSFRIAAAQAQDLGDGVHAGRLHVPGCAPRDVVLRVLRVCRDPGGPLVRVARARFVAQNEELMAWYAERSAAQRSVAA